jgi:hypothetical protein
MGAQLEKIDEVAKLLIEDVLKMLRHTRNHPKIPCAEHIIARKVARVVVGSLDPNREILGTGLLALQDAGVEIALAGKSQMDELVEINREFISFHKRLTSERKE